MFVEVEVIGYDASVSEWLAVDNAFFYRHWDDERSDGGVVLCQLVWCRV